MSDYEARFAATVEPLVAEFRELDGRITTMEAELAGLKALRTRIKGAVRLLAPEVLPSTNGAAKSKSKPSVLGVSEETIAGAVEYLAETDGEFYAAALYDRPDWTLGGRATTQNVLNVLHERGVIRLVRMERGGRKIFEVVR